MFRNTETTNINMLANAQTQTTLLEIKRTNPNTLPDEKEVEQTTIDINDLKSQGIIQKEINKNIATISDITGNSSPFRFKKTLVIVYTLSGLLLLTGGSIANANVIAAKFLMGIGGGVLSALTIGSFIQRKYNILGRIPIIRTSIGGTIQSLPEEDKNLILTEAKEIDIRIEPNEALTNIQKKFEKFSNEELIFLLPPYQRELGNAVSDALADLNIEQEPKKLILEYVLHDQDLAKEFFLSACSIWKKRETPIPINIRPTSPENINQIARTPHLL